MDGLRIKWCGHKELTYSSLKDRAAHILQHHYALIKLIKVPAELGKLPFGERSNIQLSPHSQNNHRSFNQGHVNSTRSPPPHSDRYSSHTLIFRLGREALWILKVRNEQEKRLITDVFASCCLGARCSDQFCISFSLIT